MNETVDASSTWKSFKAPPTYPILQTVSLTYCFPHFAAIDTEISVNGSTPRAEPALSKSNDSSVLYNGDVLRQLGADGVKRTLNDRGILTLEKSQGWTRATRLETSSERYYTPGGSTMALDGSYGFGMYQIISLPHSTTNWRCRSTYQTTKLPPVVPYQELGDCVRNA